MLTVIKIIDIDRIIMDRFLMLAQKLHSSPFDFTQRIEEVLWIRDKIKQNVFELDGYKLPEVSK